MSAALQVPLVWGAAAPQPRLLAEAAGAIQKRRDEVAQKKATPEREEAEPRTSWAFYRSHTTKLLRRYLYASLQVGRSPNVLDEPVGRGWASSSRIRTFEDALIFVLDVERCLNKLDRMERVLVQRVVLQEYTHAETGAMYRMATRTVHSRLNRGLDKLSELMVESGVLVLPR